MQKRPRPFHDLRHTAITNDAAAGSSPIAVMTKARRANMATRRYLHLVGVVFGDEADTLEWRLGLSTELIYPTCSSRDDLRAADSA